MSDLNEDLNHKLQMRLSAIPFDHEDNYIWRIRCNHCYSKSQKVNFTGSNYYSVCSQIGQFWKCTILIMIWWNILSYGCWNDDYGNWQHIYHQSFCCLGLNLKNSAKKPDEPHNKNYQILSQWNWWLNAWMWGNSKNFKKTEIGKNRVPFS